MGRELRRVPLDFSWPLNKTWEGYLNPHARKCPDCENGSTVDADWLSAVVHLIMMLREPDRRHGLHPWLQVLPFRPRAPPTKRAEELTSGLAGRAPSGIIGHDAIDNWQAVKAIVKAAGLPEDWGTCKTCGGDNQDPASKEAYERWEKEDHEPPTGPGFQLWETTSEGSPVSPVFADLGALCEWAAPNATTFGSSRASAEQWRKMLDADFVCHQEGNAIFL